MALFTDLVDNIKGLLGIKHININGWVFDAMLKMKQTQQLQITQHPVESGANISDHAYRTGKVFTFEIGMTDTTLGKQFLQFGLIDRHLKAYDVLDNFQKERTLVSLNGKYGFYNNILVKSVEVDDDYTTKYGMRATVILEELLISSTQIVSVSASPHVTNMINSGTKSVTPASENVSALVSFGVPGGFF